jgi:hypothetical protein
MTKDNQYYRERVAGWRKEVRSGTVTVSEIATREGLPLTSVDAAVYGDRYLGPVDGQHACARKNPGKTKRKLTEEQVLALRRGGEIDVAISRATKSKIINNIIYKHVKE